MTNQIQKTALKIILGAFILASAVACNNKADDKKKQVGNNQYITIEPPFCQPLFIQKK